MPTATLIGPAVTAGKPSPHYPQKVLILSDAHIGGGASNFAAYQASIITLMANYDHVILNGDNIELFLVKSDHAKDLSAMLEVLTGKSSDYWTKKEFKKSGKRETYPAVENMIRGGELFFREFLERCPDTKLHVVLGNHEAVRKFKSTLRELQDTHGNFEWDEEAIRIGDALFTHGHLPLKKKTGEEYGEVRLRDAEKTKRWTRAYKALGKPIHQIESFVRTPYNTSSRVMAQLSHWAGQSQFSYTHERERKPLTLDWIRHIFTGHTHHKFDNYTLQADSPILHHNTGAIVHATSEYPSELGILEATLNGDGTLANVHPVKLMKDRHAVPAR